MTDARGPWRRFVLLECPHIPKAVKLFAVTVSEFSRDGIDCHPALYQLKAAGYGRTAAYRLLKDARDFGILSDGGKTKAGLPSSSILYPSKNPENRNPEIGTNKGKLKSKGKLRSRKSRVDVSSNTNRSKDSDNSESMVDVTSKAKGAKMSKGAVDPWADEQVVLLNSPVETVKDLETGPVLSDVHLKFCDFCKKDITPVTETCYCSDCEAVVAVVYCKGCEGTFESCEHKKVS